MSERPPAVDFGRLHYTYRASIGYACIDHDLLKALIRDLEATRRERDELQLKFSAALDEIRDNATALADQDADIAKLRAENNQLKAELAMMRPSTAK